MAAEHWLAFACLFGYLMDCKVVMEVVDYSVELVVEEDVVLDSE